MDDTAGPTVRSAPEGTAAQDLSPASSSRLSEAPPDADAAAGTGRRRGRVPALVWAITALHVGLMLVFSLLYPPFTGFDEAQHVDAVLSLRHGDGWPSPDERLLSAAIVTVATPTLVGIGDLPFTDDDPPPREVRPSFADRGVEQDNTSYLIPNQIMQHPPLYYATGAAVLAVLPGAQDWSYDRTVGVLRLLSIALLAPLPLLAWATARRLGAGAHVATAAAALTLTAPQLQRVGGTVTNDSLYSLAFAGSVLVLVGVALGDLRRRTAVLTGVVVGIALLSKGFALALPVAMVAVWGVGRLNASRTERVPWRTALGSLALAEGVAFVVGGWWWLRNLVVFGTVQHEGSEAFRDARLGRPVPDGTPAPLLSFVDGAYERLSSRFWGGLGINYDGPATYPAWWTDLLVVLGAAALVIALVRLTRTRRSLALAGAVLLPFAGTVAIVLIAVYGGWSYSRVFPGAQGRYLFGSLPSLAAGVALGLGFVAGRAARVLPAAVLVLAAGMQLVGGHRVVVASWMPAYDGRPDVERLGTALTAVAEWSPWSPPTTVAMAAVPALASLALLVLLVRSVRSEPAAA